ncbi:MAG TPA: helix-turn-helix domain-containing protein [Bacteroidales bacterium]|nr:helix-turn-helix domain-containing protein [Bacteroidales bacterium]HPS49253.1 helix-turn-helix domain-containing protein [Bacteroidales bacterium]
MFEEKLLTRAEAAALLHCGLTTIWKLTREKKLPFYRVGRRYLFKENELLASIKQN